MKIHALKTYFYVLSVEKIFPHLNSQPPFFPTSSSRNINLPFFKLPYSPNFKTLSLIFPVIFLCPTLLSQNLNFSFFFSSGHLPIPQFSWANLLCPTSLSQNSTLIYKVFRVFVFNLIKTIWSNVAKYRNLIDYQCKNNFTCIIDTYSFFFEKNVNYIKPKIISNPWWLSLPFQ